MKKLFLFTFITILFVSCSTTKIYNKKDIVNLGISDGEKNITIELKVNEIRLLTYEENYLQPEIGIRISTDQIKDIDVSFSNSFIIINGNLVSNEWISSSSSISDNFGTTELMYKINGKIIEYIKTIRNIPIIEDFRKNEKNIKKFEKIGNFNNIFNLENNYVSTLNTFLNTPFSELLNYLKMKNINFEVDNESNLKLFYLYIEIDNTSYLSLAYSKDTYNAYWCSYILENNNIENLHTKLLNELGDPNDISFHKIGYSWIFTNLGIMLYLNSIQSATIIQVLKK